MDLEHLTKHQIVLLTLLVSFVTSIATGIVTVSLVNQAPPGVTRTINQIVERTVERVVPATQGATAPATVTEHTVVVKDDDLAAQSIAKVQKSLVRLTARGGDLLLTRGVIVTAQGTAFADRQALLASGARSFDAILSDGNRYPATLRAGASGQSLAVVDITVGTSTGFAAAPIADPSKVQLGQSVIRIGGSGGDTVGTGVVASLPGQSHAGLIESSVSSATPGSVLITLFGEMLGISTSASEAQSASLYTVPNMTLITAPAAKNSS